MEIIGVSHGGKWGRRTSQPPSSTSWIFPIRDSEFMAVLYLVKMGEKIYYIYQIIILRVRMGGINKHKLGEQVTGKTKDW